MENSPPSGAPTSGTGTDQNAGTPDPSSGATPVHVPVDQPQTVTGDTTVIAQQTMMPGQAPYQPMMPQPMGYPGQLFGGYPYQPQQPMPMYPQGYPQQPQPMPPGYPQQPAPGLPAQPPPAAAGTEVDVPEVSLPDPSQTGAVDESAKSAPTAGSTGGGGADDGDSTNAAADIIRQYTQRRPGG